ncbi:hypothetical protein LXL04_030880 [Taraxacum kok-saghyz]
MEALAKQQASAKEASEEAANVGGSSVGDRRKQQALPGRATFAGAGDFSNGEQGWFDRRRNGRENGI